MLLGQELINVFNPDVLILFDCGSGEMLKAALSQRVVSVGIVPNKTHKDLLMNVLRKFVEALSLVNFMDGPTKPLSMIKFEADHPDNDDVRRSVAQISSVIRADPMTPKAAAPHPSTPHPSTPQTPRTPTPAPAPVPKGSPPAPQVIISSPSGPSTQNPGVLQFGTRAF